LILTPPANRAHHIFDVPPFRLLGLIEGRKAL
jgi:hypothetical protein